VSGGRVLLAALMLAAMPGCAYVTANQNATSTVSGEMWYVKQRAFIGLVFSSRVFHCAPPGPGPAKCKEATIAKGASLADLANATANDTAGAAAKTADDANAEKEAAAKDAAAKEAAVKDAKEHGDKKDKKKK
jgi:hypothetical protein